MIVCKQFHINSAHFLPDYPGKCANVHGHTWVIEVCVDGPVDEDTGMVIDFVELKNILNKLDATLDHKSINLYVENPTAENMVRFMQEFVSRFLPEGVMLHRLRVYENVLFGQQAFAEDVW